MVRYPMRGCKSKHICHDGISRRGWCILSSGHKCNHQCGQCASHFSSRRRRKRDKIYTRRDVVRLLEARLNKYERLAREHGMSLSSVGPGLAKGLLVDMSWYESRQIYLGCVIDELVALIEYFSSQD